MSDDLRAALALLMRPASLVLLGHLARRARSIGEVLLDLDAVRAIRAGDGYSDAWRHDLAAGEREEARLWWCLVVEALRPSR